MHFFQRFGREHPVGKIILLAAIVLLMGIAFNNIDFENLEKNPLVAFFLIGFLVAWSAVLGTVALMIDEHPRNILGIY